mmetsp:Transcript_4042/g.14128  ORF Transcript_4042/g.14128 Transcript_4042/m.14128 type:complete len:532 (+) Transcript_4042:3-1598(+)
MKCQPLRAAGVRSLGPSRRSRAAPKRVGLGARCEAGEGAAPPQWQAQEQQISQELAEVEEAVVEAMHKSLAEIAGTDGAGSGAAGESDETAALQSQVRASFARLTEGLVERETEVRLLMLAAFCGEHLLLLGPPGTAKSELGRRLSALVKGHFFERLLTRFSVPEELFGPLSMRGLENDQYLRQTGGYLPEATVAFVDEIFKANSAILNSLLTILNERLFDNGSNRVDVPLVCLVGASNELPESEELDALYDRFLFRYSVQQVSQGALGDLLRLKMAGSMDESEGGGDESAPGPLMLDSLDSVRERAWAEVEVPDNVVELITALREFLQQRCEPPIYVSDRRLVKAVRMLKVAAYTCGRRTVNEFDCVLLKHVVWQKPEEAGKVADWLLQRLATERGMKQVKYLTAGLYGRACRADGDEETCTALAKEAETLKQVIVSQLEQLEGDESLPALAHHLWLDPAEGARIKQTLTPMLDKARTEQQTLLKDVLTLEVALSRRTEPHILALAMPDYWRSFIREGPIEDVGPLGLSS